MIFCMILIPLIHKAIPSLVADKGGYHPYFTGGNRTMVAAATIVIMAAAKKAQQNVFALYHSYNRTILLGFIWILDFHFKIVLVRRRRYLIPIRCNNG